MAHELPEPQDCLHVLLRELAHNSEATMLRVAARSTWRMPSDFDTPVSARTAGLAQAERQLLNNHREELAELLRTASREIRLSTEPWACAVSRYDPHGHPIPRYQEQDLIRRARSLQPLVGRADLGDIAKTVSRMSSSALSKCGLSACDLAVASLRVLPCDATRVALALGLGASNRLRTAGPLLDSVLERSVGATTRTYALHAKAWCELARHRFAAAREVFQESVRSAAFPGWAAMNLLGIALRTNDRKSCVEASRIIDTELAYLPHIVSDFTVSVRRLRNKGTLQVPGLDRTLNDPDRMGYGAQSMEVVRAYF